MSNIRELEAVDDGLILTALVLYLSPDDLKECFHNNEIRLPSDIDEDELT